MVLIKSDQIRQSLEQLKPAEFSPFELLSRRRLVEKMIELTLQGVPAGPSQTVAGLRKLAETLDGIDTREVNLVVFGGGTGLSTIIGGDSSSPKWINDPFQGLKMAFPKTKSIVCTTDDGGSTGEMLKDFPLIGLGDIRHVMLSSIRPDLLKDTYGLDLFQARSVVAQLFAIFNYRFHSSTLNKSDLVKGLPFERLPADLSKEILALIDDIFSRPEFSKALKRPNCLGNLLITSAIYRFHTVKDEIVSSESICKGLRFIEALIGVENDAVLPCTTTPSLLKIRYSNGVVITGENKSGTARRGFPVDRVCVDFAEPNPKFLVEVKKAIDEADVIVLAPGSLYSSIVPVMQVPGLSQAIRDNQKAIKVLISNLWVQAGETDLAIDDPGRRFYVSDLIQAYHRNIAGGIEELFKEVLLLSLDDIPGSILQSYALEGKTPIYLDRGRVWEMGFSPIEANISSKEELIGHKVKHDPATVARALQVFVAASEYLDEDITDNPDLPGFPLDNPSSLMDVPCKRYRNITSLLAQKGIDEADEINEILWRHWDIQIEHLQFMKGVTYINRNDWARCQEWDNVYSFYDPNDGLIKIREDIRGSSGFELAFLVALGQSLLGNYALHKKITPFESNGEQLGKVFLLTLRPENKRLSYFNDESLRQYLILARMRQFKENNAQFTRVLNDQEGFTPPGLLFGLTYAWYLDNRLAEHIEYKMAIARAEISDLVPEQVRTRLRRNEMTEFFRRVVFRQNSSL